MSDEQPMGQVIQIDEARIRTRGEDRNIRMATGGQDLAKIKVRRRSLATSVSSAGNRC
jgi:hypothetical protein